MPQAYPTQTDWTTYDGHYTIPAMDHVGQVPTPSAAVLAELEKQVMFIRFRVKNDRVDYSVFGRPDPNLTPVTDEWLAPAIVFAVRTFKQVRMQKPSREKVLRVDNRTVQYKEKVTIDWKKKRIETSANEQLTLQVLAIVVENLMRSAQREAERDHKKLN